MKNIIIDKINREIEDLQLIISHVDELQSKISELKKLIERKNGSIVGLKELLEEIQAEECKLAAELENDTLVDSNQSS
jgi:hypothetical protein